MTYHRLLNLAAAVVYAVAFLILLLDLWVWRPH